MLNSPIMPCRRIGGLHAVYLRATTLLSVALDGVVISAVSTNSADAKMATYAKTR